MSSNHYPQRLGRSNLSFCMGEQSSFFPLNSPFPSSSLSRSSPLIPTSREFVLSTCTAQQQLFVTSIILVNTANWVNIVTNRSLDTKCRSCHVFNLHLSSLKTMLHWCLFMWHKAHLLNDCPQLLAWLILWHGVIEQTVHSISFLCRWTSEIKCCKLRWLLNHLISENCVLLLHSICIGLRKSTSFDHVIRKFKDFQGLVRPYYIFNNFPGPGKMYIFSRTFIDVQRPCGYPVWPWSFDSMINTFQVPAMHKHIHTDPQTDTDNPCISYSTMVGN